MSRKKTTLALIRRLDNRRRRPLLVLVTLCLVTLTLDAWQSRAWRRGQDTWLEGAICASALPAQSLITEAAHGLDTGWQMTLRGKRLAEENAQLKVRVAELESHTVLTQERAAGAARERLLQNMVKNLGYRGRPAQVVGWGDSGWNTYLVLNQGESQGVRQKDVAAARAGVVGQVYAVTPLAARVLPITDPSSAVAALVQRSRETGILKGVGRDRCELTYLAPEADIKPGDKVLTSGIGGIFPKGLALGVVTSVTENRTTPGKLAKVEPAVKFRKLEEVVVVRGVESKS